MARIYEYFPLCIDRAVIGFVIALSLCALHGSCHRLETTTDCPAKIEVEFLLEASNRVGSANWPTVISFAKTFSQGLQIGSDQVRVSAATFATDYKSEWTLDLGNDRGKLNTLFDGLAFPNGGADYKGGNALDKASKNSTNRRPDAKRVIVLVTAGITADSTTTVPTSQAIRDSGDYVMMVSVEGLACAECPAVAGCPSGGKCDLCQKTTWTDMVGSANEAVSAMCSRIYKEPKFQENHKVIRTVEGISYPICPAKMDVIFMVSNCLTMNGENNEQSFDNYLLPYLRKAVSYFSLGQDAVRTGLVAFGDGSTKYKLQWKLGDDMYTQEKVSAAIEKIPKPTTNGAYNSQGLTTLEKSLFTDMGARKDVPILVILVSDGRTKSSENMTSIATKLREDGATVAFVSPYLNEQYCSDCSELTECPIRTDCDLCSHMFWESLEDETANTIGFSCHEFVKDECDKTGKSSSGFDGVCDNPIPIPQPNNKHDVAITVHFT